MWYSSCWGCGVKKIERLDMNVDIDVYYILLLLTLFEKTQKHSLVGSYQKSYRVIHFYFFSRYSLTFYAVER